MAIKKCDDITEEGSVETTEETTTQTESQGVTDSAVQSQNLANQAATMASQALTSEIASAEILEAAAEIYQNKYKPKDSAYLGKTLSAIESTIYDGTIDPILKIVSFGNGLISAARPADIADPLRAESRSFYTLDSNERLVYFDENISDHVERYGNSVISLNKVGEPIETQSTAGSLLKAYRQGFQISSDKFIVNSDSDGVINLDPAWAAFIDGGQDSITGLSRPSPLIDTKTTFTDHYTRIETPFTPKEMERFANAINNPAYGKIEPVYSYYATGYEKYIEPSDVKEYQLENQFSVITRERSPLQKTLTDLGTDYRYVTNVRTLHADQGYDITEKYQHIGIPLASIPDIKKVTDTDELYSMYNLIEINTEKTGQFLVSAKDSGMVDDLFKHLIDQNIVYPENIASAAQANRLNFTLSAEKVTFNNNDTIIDTDLVQQNVALVDLTSWILSYLSKAGPDDVNPKFSDIAILLGVDPNLAELSSDCNAFLQTLKSLVLSGKISQVINDRFRTFEEMMAGKEAYNETIMYEIVRTGGTPQSIFVVNSDELDILKYVDTQVKYNTEYKYRVYAHQLIVGTSYFYDIFTGAQTGKTAKFAVQYEPSLKIARLPVFEQSVRILDNAPVFPDVDIIPFKGVNNQLLINLNGNTGTYVLQPIIITEQDKTFIDSYLKTRDLSSGDPITYESDDPVNQFEIYRTTTPPKSYSDFYNKLHKTISTDVSTSTSFIDDIVPNTKYYYTFRAMDVHLNLSNPTEIFMVELVEYEGMIFFNKSIYNFDDIKYNNVKTERTFKRYLQINPNLIQTMINYDKTFPDKQMDSALKATDVHLGRSEEPVWEKRFKMRITSKNSGKKFDINFTCKKRFIKPENPPIDPGTIASIAKISQGLAGQDISSAVFQTFGEQEDSKSRLQVTRENISSAYSQTFDFGKQEDSKSRLSVTRENISSAYSQTFDFGEQEKTKASRNLRNVDLQDTIETMETEQVDTERLEQIRKNVGRNYIPK